MTCIVGYVANGVVYIGADSAAAQGWEVVPLLIPKVFHRGPFLIAYTDSFRMGQILQYDLHPPEQENGEEIHQFMASKFVGAVREALRRNGWMTVKDGQESGGTFLVGYRGHLYGIHSDFQVMESAMHVQAYGVGREYALGAMLALSALAPEARIRASILIASQWCAGICEPIHVLEARP